MEKNNHKSMIHSCPPKVETPQIPINSRIHKIENCIMVLIVKMAIMFVGIVRTKREHKGAGCGMLVKAVLLM